MKQILVFIQSFILINLYYTKHDQFLDFDEDKDKNNQLNNFEKEITQGLEQMVKIIPPTPSTHLKRFPTIRIIRGPIHFKRIENLDKPDDDFPESSFLGPEISSRKIVMRKRNKHNNFPMVLGPFPEVNFMPMMKFKKLNYDNEQQFEKDLENKSSSFSIFPEKERSKSKKLTDKRKIEKSDDLENLDNIIEKGFDEFFNGMNPNSKKEIPHSKHKHKNSRNKKYKESHTRNETKIIKQKNNTVKFHEVPEHTNYTERFKQIEKTLDKPKPIVNITRKIVNTTEIKAPQKRDLKVSDLEKLEREELTKNRVNETTGIFNFIMKTINTAETKNLYISISILMLLIFIISIILCNQLITKKEDFSKCDRDTKFLHGINKKYY